MKTKNLFKENTYLLDEPEVKYILHKLNKTKYYIKRLIELEEKEISILEDIQQNPNNPTKQMQKIMYEDLIKGKLIEKKEKITQLKTLLDFLD